MHKDFGYIIFSFLMVLIIGGNNASAEDATTKKRPFFEYKGNYTEQVNALKEKFKQEFGYALVDLGKAWSPVEVEKMHVAFSKLPKNFYRLTGLNSLYRLDHFQTKAGGFPVDEIPAAALPAFLTYYEVESKSYKARLNDQDPRVEFYNGLFYEDDETFNNIVHHEMAHIVDILNGFFSFSKEWIDITGFQMVHLPSRDYQAGHDFMFRLLDDPSKDHYAPISVRHLPTYSRQNIQEDFANSTAAYIHYPYFQYSHPKRYQFLKMRVFGGEEYFPGTASSFKEKVIGDYSEAFAKKEWDRMIHIMKEMSRDPFSEIDSALLDEMDKIFSLKVDPERDFKLGIASCYLSDSGALEFRKKLIRKKMVPVEQLLKNSRCAQMGRDNFEKNLSLWAPANMVLYKSDSALFLHLLDPAQQVAYSRGFHSRYLWRIFVEGKDRPLQEGTFIVDKRGNGSVKLDLTKVDSSARPLPMGKPLTLELGIQRYHPKSFKSINSKSTRVPIAVHPDFNYIGPKSPMIRVIYPFRKAYKQFN